MCGIVGAVTAAESGREFVCAGIERMRDRGPDHAGSVHLEGVHLGHSLLSTIGEIEFEQPFWTHDKRAVIVFNGEIYNYLELMRDDFELEARCARFPRSDTVVLAEGLNLHGERFLERCNGMFAFAFLDVASMRLLLARDRLGIKPLFYRAHAGEFYFASEAQVLRATQPGRKIDPVGLYSSLRFRYPMGALSIDAGIAQLEPGFLMRVSPDGSFVQCRWWSNSHAGGATDSEQTAIERTAELLGCSLELCMRSDHGFSSFLSGGLDSSLLAALAINEKGALDTYSVGLEAEDAIDESLYARAVAEHIGSHHIAHVVDAADFQARAQRILADKGEPILVPNQVALDSVSAELAKRHRVVLSGEGADEVFGGYGRIFLLPHDWRLFQRGELTPKWVAALPAEFVHDFIGFFVERYGYTSHAFAVTELGKWGFTRDVADHARDAIVARLRELWERIDADDDRNRLMVLFQNIHLPGLLGRLDSATMRHSVEGRVPFLDYRLVEYVNTLPAVLKQKPLLKDMIGMRLSGDQLSGVADIPKFILKTIGERYIPKPIVYRAKVGFPIPGSFTRQDGAEAANGNQYESWIASNMHELREKL